MSDGTDKYGTPYTGVPADLKDVRAIYSTQRAFAALKEDGTVQAWGLSALGGSVPDDLKDVRAIYSTFGAFAALKEDGTVQALMLGIQLRVNNDSGATIHYITYL